MEIAGALACDTERTGGRCSGLGAPGSSVDGSYLYFVSTSVLAHSGATSAGHNLYVDRYDEATRTWQPTFIAALAGQDGYNSGGPQEEFDNLTARVSANGRFLAFQSQRSLTGYDNRDATGYEKEELPPSGSKKIRQCRKGRETGTCA